MWIKQKKSYTLPRQYEAEYLPPCPTQSKLNSCKAAAAWENLEPYKMPNKISDRGIIRWFSKLKRIIPSEELMQIAKDVAW